MTKERALVICIHNSSRSQMTEEYLRRYAGDILEVESAGLEPGTLNPVVVELLKEDGIDISGKATKSLFELHKAGRHFEYIFAVCDPEAKERCPIFPAEKRRIHWPFPDPSKTTGTFEEKLATVRLIREDIKKGVQEWVSEYRQSMGAQ
jgi:arsenate reductase